jgi:ribosome-associated toxin RatA of RatAB toxin-antitoxin module
MIQLNYAIDIDRPLKDVYALARQVERHPEFLPDYLSCRVVERQPDRLLLERTALIRGKLEAWRSWVSFRENEGLYFVHQGGRLNGMQVTWQFNEESPRRTRMTITQTFHIRLPFPWVGSWLEKKVFGPKLSNIAQRVIRSFKRACEASVEVVA